jgi:iron(III) transport system substrate-binding protein
MAAFLLPGLSFAQGEVVVYTALDREYSEPILKAYEAKTGVRVRPVYDAEASKTVGLVNRLLAERSRPQCDVFWNNEIIRTLQLKAEGLSEPYVSPAAADFPTAMKDPEGHWTGFATRARVIIVNWKLLPDEATWPRSIEALTDPRWKDRCAVAKPLFGTTATHAAALWHVAGPEKSEAFWNAALANAAVLPGNGPVRDAVASGQLAWGLTDSDDAQGAIIDGAPVAMVRLEKGTLGLGAVQIPNTLMLVKGAPNAANGKALIDHLLSAEVESALAAGRAAQLPVRPGLTPPKGIPTASEFGDWNGAFQALKPSATALTKIAR